MDADYLKQNVGPILAEGLAQVIIKNPTDPVEYLALWLQKYIDNVGREEKEKKESASLRLSDEKLNAQETAAKRNADAKAAGAKEVVEAREAKLIDFLHHANDLDSIFDTFADYLKDLTGASGVYIGKVEAPDALVYVAATEENKFLIDKKLLKPAEEEQAPGSGVTFDLFVDEEKEPDQDDPPQDDFDPDDPDREPPPPKPPVEIPPKTVFVPNVLMGPLSNRVLFHRLPKTGCYYAMRIRYDATLNDKTLDDSVAAEKALLEAHAKGVADPDADPDDDPDAKSDSKDTKAKLDSSPPKVETEAEREARLKHEAEQKEIEFEKNLLKEVPLERTDYALCLDTLGQNRRFTPEEIEAIIRCGKLLTSTLEKLDRNLFKAERIKRAALLEANKTIDEKSDDDKKNSLDVIASQLEKSGKPATEEDAQFRYRQNLLMSMRRLVSEFRTYNVFRGNLQVLQVLFYLLDYTQAQVADSNNNPQWKKMRLLFNDDLFGKIKAYDPRTEQLRGKDGAADKYATIKSLTKLLRGVEYEQVKEVNYPLAEIFGYCSDALAVKRKAAAEREAARLLQEQKDKEDAELKAAEALVAAEKAAAEALAAGGGGDGKEPADDPDPDEDQ